MLSPELLESRSGSITASSAHAIMTGWDKARPTDEYPPEIYAWIENNAVKPAVAAIKGKIDCDVSMKLIDAAWKAYQFDKPSQGLITYAEELACDELFDDDPSLEFTSTHMDNGNEREIDAVYMLREATGLNFVKTGEDQIHISVDGIGATPDGLVYDDLDLISTGCEVKCRSPIHHARQLFITDNATLMEHDFDRFVQIQVACLVAGVDHWYSAGYNPYAKLDAHSFNYCIIKRDDAFLDIFKERAALTFKYKAAFLERLNGLNVSQNKAA